MRSAKSIEPSGCEFGYSVIDNCQHMMYNVYAYTLIVGLPDLRDCEPFGYAGAELGTGHIVQSVGE